MGSIHNFMSCKYAKNVMDNIYHSLVDYLPKLFKL